MNEVRTSRISFKGREFAAFLFDMDGTLLDSSAAVERIWRRWAERHGIDANELVSVVHGVRGEDVIRRFGPSDIDVAAEASFLHDLEMGDVNGIVPIGGVEKLLTSLDARRWAIVTSASRDLALVRLRAANLPITGTLVAADDVKRGKPDPEGFLKAAALLHAPIADCLVFEDSAAGVEAARAAGAKVVVIGNRVQANYAMHSLVDYHGILRDFDL